MISPPKIFIIDLASNFSELKLFTDCNVDSYFFSKCIINSVNNNDWQQLVDAHIEYIKLQKEDTLKKCISLYKEGLVLARQSTKIDDFNTCTKISVAYWKLALMNIDIGFVPPMLQVNSKENDDVVFEKCMIKELFNQVKKIKESKETCFINYNIKNTFLDINLSDFYFTYEVVDFVCDSKNLEENIIKKFVDGHKTWAIFFNDAEEDDDSNKADCVELIYNAYEEYIRLNISKFRYLNSILREKKYRKNLQQDEAKYQKFLEFEKVVYDLIDRMEKN